MTRLQCVPNLHPYNGPMFQGGQHTSPVSLLHAGVVLSPSAGQLTQETNVKEAWKASARDAHAAYTKLNPWRATRRPAHGLLMCENHVRLVNCSTRTYMHRVFLLESNGGETSSILCQLLITQKLQNGRSKCCRNANARGRCTRSTHTHTHTHTCVVICNVNESY